MLTQLGTRSIRLRSRASSYRASSAQAHPLGPSSCSQLGTCHNDLKLPRSGNSRWNTPCSWKGSGFRSEGCKCLSNKPRAGLIRPNTSTQGCTERMNLSRCSSGRSRAGSSGFPQRASYQRSRSQPIQRREHANAHWDCEASRNARTFSDAFPILDPTVAARGYR